MKDSLIVAKWEIKKNLTNKTFIISILLTPIIILIFGALPTLLSQMEMNKSSTIYIIDKIGIYQEIQDNINSQSLKLVNYQGTEQQLREEIKGRQRTAYLVLDESVFEQQKITLYNADEGELNTKQLESALNYVLKEYKMQELALPDESIDLIMTDYIFNTQSLISKDENGLERIIPAVFSMVILISVFITGTMTMQSSLQEKKDRIVEVLVSSISPYDLMRGKIIGYFIIGVLQILVWMIMIIPVVQFVYNIPVLQYIFVRDMPIMLLFALMGYLMYSSLFVGMGATMDDVQSAGNFQGIIMIIPMLPLFLVGPIMLNPNGMIAKVGSFFPLSAPGVMLLRMAILSHVDWWEILLSSVLIVLTIILIVRIAGKLFKVGMLMYGKNATPAEILKWLKY